MFAGTTTALKNKYYIIIISDEYCLPTGYKYSLSSQKHEYSTVLTQKLSVFVTQFCGIRHPTPNIQDL